MRPFVPAAGFRWYQIAWLMDAPDLSMAFSTTAEFFNQALPSQMLTALGTIAGACWVASCFLMAEVQRGWRSRVLQVMTLVTTGAALGAGAVFLINREWAMPFWDAPKYVQPLLLIAIALQLRALPNFQGDRFTPAVLDPILWSAAVAAL